MFSNMHESVIFLVLSQCVDFMLGEKYSLDKSSYDFSAALEVCKRRYVGGTLPIIKSSKQKNLLHISIYRDRASK